MPDSPELPRAQDQERDGRQKEQNRSQYEPQNDQNEAQHEAHDRFE